MDSFKISGLGGERKLKGEYVVSGSKNSGLPAFAMAMLFDGDLVLKNIPQIEDIYRISEIVEKMGAGVKKDENTFSLNIPKDMDFVIDRELGGTIRSSVILTGLVLARNKKVKFYFPGGCSIGKRPIDLFLSSFEKMGAVVAESGDAFEVSAGAGLVGAEIIFPLPSVTVTETIMMAAVLAKGETILKNVAMEPEIVCLAEYLNSVGAEISGAGTPEMVISGRAGKLLSAVEGRAFVNMADRIEAGSIATLAALCGEDVLIKNYKKKDLEIFTATLEEIGVKMNFEHGDVLRIKSQGGDFKAVDIKTHEHPGFPTDLQSQIGVLLTQAEGESKIFETIFESRLGYLEGLSRMGAKTDMWNVHQASIHGPASLSGKSLLSPDLRAGFAFIIAGAVASGETVIKNSYVVKRGYENIIEKLKGIGLDISEE